MKEERDMATCTEPVWVVAYKHPCSVTRTSGPFAAQDEAEEFAAEMRAMFPDSTVRVTLAWEELFSGGD